MGRRKQYSSRFLIGLDEIQSNVLKAMAASLGMSYSEIFTLLMDYYQRGDGEVKVK